MSEDWCREKLANLQIKDRRLDTLNEIRSQLHRLPAADVATVSSNFLTLPDVFDCVEDNRERNDEQCNAACDILSMCMANLDLGQQQTKNAYYLERSLQHSNDEVKIVGLNEIERICTQAPDQVFSQNIVIGILKCLENPKEKVGALAAKILPNILPKFMYDEGVQSHLMSLLTSVDVIRYRAYEVCITIAKASRENLEKFSSVTDRVCMDLNTQDALLVLNVLEMLSDLAQTEHGWVYLENKGVFKKITENVENLDANPLKNLLIPGYMKFFGNVATKQPTKIIQGFPMIINALLDCILFDTDSTILPVVFDTLGQLGFDSQGKILLEDNYSQKLNQSLNEIGKSIHNLSTRLQIRALNCLEILFRCDTDNNRVNTITKHWFSSLTGKNGMAFIMDFCRNPFPEIKIAALTLLKAIVESFWGQQAVEETAGFVEFLLDRCVEFNKEAMHEKFIIVGILANSSAFDKMTLLQLNRYIQQGPFYVRSDMDVAVEGQR